MRNEGKKSFLLKLGNILVSALIALTIALMPAILLGNLFLENSSTIGGYRIAELVLRTISAIISLLYFDYKLTKIFSINQ